MKTIKRIFSRKRYFQIFLLLAYIQLHAALPKVLLLASESSNTNITDVQSKLNATGMFSIVDYFNFRSATPDVSILEKYNAVLLWTNGSVKDYSLLGNALATYIENGGGVVDAVFENASIPVAGKYDSSAYRCLVPLWQKSGFLRTMDTILLPDHPIMKDIMTFNAGSSSFLSTSDSIAPGSYVVARYDNGDIFIAARENVGSAKVRRVSLNFFPPSSDINAGYWDKNTDGARIMANALTWVVNLHNILPEVLLAGAESNRSYLADVREKILSAGLISGVDTIDLRYSTPSLSLLEQYKAVLVWTDATPLNDSILGNTLADYIDEGGLVVDAVFSLDLTWGITKGRFTTPTYQCLNRGNYVTGSVRTLGTIALPANPIMTGVSSFSGGTTSFHNTINTLAPNAYIVASYDNNDIFIAAKENVGPAKARRVSLNFWPVSSDINSNGWNPATDGAKIMTNALHWDLDSNNCLNFNGVNDYISTNINPNEGAPFTYMASVYPTTASGEKMILGTCTSTSSWNGMWFAVEPDLKLRFYGGNEVLSSDLLPANQWSDVAVSYEDTTVRLYINGLLQAESKLDLSGITGGNLYIGAIGSGDLSDYLFNGNLDNISMWNKALTGADILKFQTRKLVGSESGLIAYYNFDQGIAGGNNPADTILLDIKSAAYRGSLHNFALTGITSNWIGLVGNLSNNVPTVQAKNVTFSGASGNHVSVNWTRGNGEKCAVFVKSANSGTALPEFESTYTASANFGSGSQIGTSGWYCIYNGTGNSAILSNLTKGATYVVHVCEYNGTSGSEDYNFTAFTNNPNVNTFTTIFVDETSLTSEINVYPNPANDYLTIESPDNSKLHYNLYDLSGKLVLTGTLNGNKLNISNLSPGIYILDINRTNKFKIIKQ